MRFLLGALATIWTVQNATMANAAPPDRVATHRLIVVSAEAAPSKANGKWWDVLGSCDLAVRVSRRDLELEKRWTVLESQRRQRELAVAGLGAGVRDPALAAIELASKAVAKEFIGETPAPKPGLRREWNYEAIEVATGDVLLLQVLDIDGAEHDVVGDMQWRVTKEALTAGRPIALSFGRVVHLTLEFRPLGAAPAALDVPLSRAERRLQDRIRRRVGDRVKGADNDVFVLALNETSWRPRELDFGDVIRGATAITDLALFPIVIMVRGGNSLASELPPPPPNTVRVDDIRFEVVAGRESAMDRIVAYSCQLMRLPAFPDGMPRVRSFAVVGRHQAAADAEQEAERLRDRVAAQRRGR